MRCLIGLSLLVCALVVDAVATAAPVTVSVGNPGNLPDQNYGGRGQFGAVPYGYEIAIHEVTNAEYVAFLALHVGIQFDRFFPFATPTFSDSRGLLNQSMIYDLRGGINVYTPPPCTPFTCPMGDPGPDIYPPPHFRVRTTMANKPVNYVSWYDAIRYVNWLNGSGTETGAYNLGPLGPGGVPLNPVAITRNPNATWFLPNEDEWYKAAYHQPAEQGGDSDGYWLNPTGCNCETATTATADANGNISNPGLHVMNIGGANWNGLTNHLTTVGSAGPDSASFYGTFDQGGNVREWTESEAFGARVVRGGSTDPINSTGYFAGLRHILSPTDETADLGFRVARLVPIPEPSTLTLGGAAAIGFLVVLYRQIKSCIPFPGASN
jgi:formylglycine-generating enzyme required for sulfatase activity